MKNISRICIITSIAVIIVATLIASNVVLKVITQTDDLSGKSDLYHANNYPYNDSAILVINDEIVPFQGVYFYQLGTENCVSVPFIGFLEALGYQFELVDEDRSVVIINNTEYFFSKKSGSLFNAEGGENCIIPCSGKDTYHLSVEEQDVYYDAKVIVETIDSLGDKMHIEVSCEEKKIVVGTD